MKANPLERLRNRIFRNRRTGPDSISASPAKSDSEGPPRTLNSRPSPWGPIVHPAPGELYVVTREITVSYVVEERFGTHGGSVHLPAGAKVAVWSGIFSNPFDPLPNRVPCDYADTDPKRVATFRRSAGLGKDQRNYHLEIEIEQFVLGHLEHLP